MLGFSLRGNGDALFLCCQTDIYSLVILSFLLAESVVQKLLTIYGIGTEHFPSSEFNDVLSVLLTRPLKCLSNVYDSLF